MKAIKLFLFLFAIVFVCEHTRAQEDLPYRPFKSFHNDTIRYLDYNFTIRNDQYLNKPAGEFFNDLELPIVYVSYLVAQFKPSGGGSDIVAMNLVIRKVGNGDYEGDYSRDYYIRIFLTSPVDGDNFANALYRDERNKGKTDYYYWTPQLRELLKDYELGGFLSNNNLIKDRQQFLKRNTKESREKLAKAIEAEKTNWRKVIQAEKQAIKK